MNLFLILFFLFCLNTKNCRTMKVSHVHPKMANIRYLLWFLPALTFYVSIVSRSMMVKWSWAIAHFYYYYYFLVCNSHLSFKWQMSTIVGAWECVRSFDHSTRTHPNYTIVGQLSSSLVFVCFVCYIDQLTNRFNHWMRSGLAHLDTLIHCRFEIDFEAHSLLNLIIAIIIDIVDADIVHHW